MNTTVEINKGSLMVKGLFLIVLSAGLGAPIYMFYHSSDSCRALESISKNAKLNSGLKTKLVEYLNRGQVKSFLLKSSGEVFSISDFGEPFPPAPEFDEYNITNRDLQLVIKTDNPDKSFRGQLSVSAVGIGFSRAYLMYENDINSKNEDLGLFELELREDSYVNCRVYD